jgi:hypothetical protein
MVDKKYKDFDAAVEEADKKPIEFKIAGKDYEKEVLSIILA